MDKWEALREIFKRADYNEGGPWACPVCNADWNRVIEDDILLCLRCGTKYDIVEGKAIIIDPPAPPSPPENPDYQSTLNPTPPSAESE